MSMPFFKRLDEIDRMLAAEPSRVAVQRLRDLVLEFASEAYLFHTAPAAWIEVFEREAWFRNPPEPQTDERGTRVSRWPASDYLVRVTRDANRLGDSHLLDAAKRVIAEIPVVQNPFIFQNIVDAMLQMRAPDIADLTPVLQSWLGQQSTVWTKAVPTLIGRLTDAGFRTASMRLLRSAFAVLPDTAFYTTPEEKRLLPEPRSLLRDWEYEQQLSAVLRPVGNKGELGIVAIFAQLLHDAVRFSQKDLSFQGPADSSFVWRPAVEDHAQNRGSNVKSVLVSALRDACERFLKDQPDRFGDVIELLEAQQWFIFTRIILHLLHVSPSASGIQISEYLTNRSYFGEITVRHEYALLLKTHFGNLTDDARTKVLRLIADGPDTISYSRGQARWTGKEPSVGQIDKYIKHWQLDWLAFIQDVLTGESKAWFESLASEAAPSEHPEFPTYIEGGSFVGGPRSPIKPDELGKKSPGQVLEYIRSWFPHPETNRETHVWHDEPESVSGLANVLTTVVQSNAQEFSGMAKQFIGLDPTYIRGFLDGISNAVRKRDTINWPPVVALYNWAAREQDTTGSRDAFADRDANWMWTKQTITRVLQEALNEESSAVPLSCRDDVWNTIDTLLHNPDALQGNEEEELGSHFDPLTRSLNTVSGSALHAAIKYALWVRHFEKSFQGISSIPEFAAALEYVLAHPEVYGLTSRAVLGQWFPWLVLIDATWARDQVDKIFPEQREQAKLWEAAWSTYMDYCAPYDQPFELLRGKYSFALNELARGSIFRSTRAKPAERLGEHLLSFYWRGKIGLEEDGLVRAYFRTCSVDASQHSLEFVGRSLRRSQVRDEVSQRLEALLDSLIEDVRSRKIDPMCLVSFGWWFDSPRLNEKWKVSCLLEILRYTFRVDPTDTVLESLVSIAERLPLEAAQAVSMMAKGTYEPWDYEYWSPKAFTVLRKVMASKADEVRSVVAEAAERFGVNGRIEFRQFAVPTD